MKKALLLLIALPALLLSGCGSDDDNNATYPTEMAGPWQLVNVSGSIAGINHYYTDFIMWNFDTDDRNVNISNQNDEDVEDFLETGVYDYDFVINSDSPSACARTLKVGDTNFGCMMQDANTLTLTQTEADGYTLTFERILLD
jgi:hypothetical protein